jgi:hypothetical protein
MCIQMTDTKRIQGWKIRMHEHICATSVHEYMGCHVTHKRQTNMHARKTHAQVRMTAINTHTVSITQELQLRVHAGHVAWWHGGRQLVEGKDSTYTPGQHETINNRAKKSQTTHDPGPIEPAHTRYAPLNAPINATHVGTCTRTHTRDRHKTKVH